MNDERSYVSNNDCQNHVIVLKLRIIYQTLYVLQIQSIPDCE